MRLISFPSSARALLAATLLSVVAAPTLAAGSSTTDSALEAAQRELDRAERLYGPDKEATARALYELARVYNNQGQNAQAEPLLTRSLSIYDQLKVPSPIGLVNVLNMLGLIYNDENKLKDARPLLQRAVGIVEKHYSTRLDEPGPISVIANLAGVYSNLGESREAQPLYRRLVASSEKTYGPNDPKTQKYRDMLAMHNRILAERGQTPSTGADTRASLGDQRTGPSMPSPGPRPMASQTEANPSPPNSSGSRLNAGGLMTPQGATLKVPKGYEQIKPAQLYTISINALNDPRWIVARSKAEAVQIGNKPMYGFYDTFKACMAGLRDDCRKTVELDFGWMAFVTATGFYRAPAGHQEQKINAYVAYGAPSQQIAIDGALAEYRRNRASDGVVAQVLTVGLVSELDWQAIESMSNRSSGSYMGHLNYKTVCDWAPSRGFNQNPEPTTGKIDGDPACKKQEDPPGKRLPLPPPVLVLSNSAR